MAGCELDRAALALLARATRQLEIGFSFCAITNLCRLLDQTYIRSAALIILSSLSVACDRSVNVALFYRSWCPAQTIIVVSGICLSRT